MRFVKEAYLNGRETDIAKRVAEDKGWKNLELAHTPE